MKKSISLGLALSLLALAVVTVLNGWVYMYRKNGFQYDSTNRQEIYASSHADPGRFAGYLQGISPDEKAILLDHLAQAGVNETQNTEEKIIRIGRYLLTRVVHLTGRPDPRWYRLPKYQQFEWIWEGKTEIWCTQFQLIYNVMANLAGIPTRRIFLERMADYSMFSYRRDNSGSGGHTFSESHIPETGQWAYVDFSVNTMFIKDSEGNHLNTVALADAVNGRRPTAGLHVTRHVSGRDEAETIPFQSVDLTPIVSRLRGDRFLIGFDNPNPDGSLVEKIIGYVVRPYRVIPPAGGVAHHGKKLFLLALELLLLQMTAVLGYLFLKQRRAAGTGAAGGSKP